MAEVNYEFRKKILEVHKPNRKMEWSIPSEQDVEVTSDWSITIPTMDEPVLYNAARDLEDYFAVSMGIFPKVVVGRAEGACIEYQTDDSLEEHTYKLIADKEHIVLIGSDVRQAARAGYFLEDLMNLSEGPFVKYQETTRKSLYHPRLVHSGFGLDIYPDAHLRALAHAGMTGILLYVTGVDETPHGHLDFNDLIYRAGLYGLDVYAYCIMLSKVYPEGDEGYRYYDSLYGELFRRCPGFKGVFLVGESNEFPSKDKHSCGTLRLDNIDENGNKIIDKPSPGWWPCYDWPLFLNMVKDIVRRYAPDADIMFETYNWGYVEEKYRLEFVRNFPKDMSLVVTWEVFEFVKKDGVDNRITDYSLFFEGPGNCFVSEAKCAKEQGLRLYTSANTGGLTWDVGVIPYEPTPYQWLKRYQAMRHAHDNWGLCGNFESHHYGVYPSFISDFAKWMFEAPDSNSDGVLRNLAVRDYSESCADEVLKAWKLFSEAMEYFVPTNADQYGPLRVGPAYPLLLYKEDFVFKSRPGTKHGNNEICFPMYRYKKYDEQKEKFRKEITWYQKVAELYDEGAAILENVVDQIHDSKQHEAKKQANMGRFIAATARTTVNVKEWYLAKLRLSSQDEAERREAALQLHEIGEREIQNALNTIPMVQFDSRLGWEPSMEYMCDEAHILDKITATRRVLDEELIEYLR